MVIQLQDPGCYHGEVFFKTLEPNCQNPNLTTTQPQPNLNLVGFDTIITLHTPHPPPTPHRNSNSTRTNGPRGLKFVMQHHPAIITTTQHNFNPTIFWGGGIMNPSPTHCILLQLTLSRLGKLHGKAQPHSEEVEWWRTLMVECVRIYQG